MLVEQRRCVTIDGRVRWLEVTKAAVKPYAQVLELRQYVAKAGLVKAKGRPGWRYVLSENAIALFF